MPIRGAVAVRVHGALGAVGNAVAVVVRGADRDVAHGYRTSLSVRDGYGVRQRQCAADAGRGEGRGGVPRVGVGCRAAAHADGSGSVSRGEAGGGCRGGASG